MDFHGPHGHIVYKGNGHFHIHPKDEAKRTMSPVNRHFSRLGLLVGGSGISTMFSLTNFILKRADDPTRIWLIIADKTGQDILLRFILNI
jgi:nitrate reductase (NAD(P)H)